MHHTVIYCVISTDECLMMELEMSQQYIAHINITSQPSLWRIFISCLSLLNQMCLQFLRLSTLQAYCLMYLLAKVPRLNPINHGHEASATSLAVDWFFERLTDHR